MFKQAVAVETAKASPPVTIAAGAFFGGVSLNGWVAVVTIGYVLLQAAYLIWKWYKEVHPKN